MTSDEFRALLRDHTDADLLGTCLRADLTPYVFGANATSWNVFSAEIATKIGAAVDDIRIVGSARLGFSLKPRNNLKAFSETSDIDLLVVNSALFDELWMGLLQVAYPRGLVAEQVGGWLRTRRNELYTGWLSPLEIIQSLDHRILGQGVKPLQRFSATWFTTLKAAARHVVQKHEDITARLYRTWEHADMYHIQSLAQLRTTLEVPT